VVENQNQRLLQVSHLSGRPPVEGWPRRAGSGRAPEIGEPLFDGPGLRFKVGEITF
jgi:hypothetical protein